MCLFLYNLFSFTNLNIIVVGIQGNTVLMEVNWMQIKENMILQKWTILVTKHNSLLIKQYTINQISSTLMLITIMQKLTWTTIPQIKASVAMSPVVLQLMCLLSNFMKKKHQRKNIEYWAAVEIIVTHLIDKIADAAYS